MIVNENIKLWIFQLGISNNKFANQLGYHSQTIDRIIKNKNFNVDVIDAIASKYPNLNIDWLFTGRGQQYFKESDEINLKVEEPEGGYEKKITLLTRKCNSLVVENNDLKDRVIELQRMLLNNKKN